MNKNQLADDIKYAENLYNKAWGEGYEYPSVDMELFKRLIDYAKLLADKN